MKVIVEHIDFITKVPFLEDYTLEDNKLVSLEPISRINFFVGANNSGKSRFLRNLAKMLNNYVSPQNSKYGPNYSKADISIIKVPYKQLMSEIEEMVKEFEIISPDLAKYFLKIFSIDKIYSEFDLVETVSELRRLTNPNAKHLSKFNQQTLKAFENISDNYESYIEGKLAVPSGKRLHVTYIPALRSLRKFMTFDKEGLSYRGMPSNLKQFEKINDSIFAIRSILDYFYEKDIRHTNAQDPSYEDTFPISNIFSGETLYEKIQELKNGNEDKREILTGFESFLSSKFFNSQPLQLNAIIHEGVQDIFVKIGTEKEFPIFHLGDGIQAIIILTFPLFYYKNYTHVILYEEPELYLHPGMQRIFVDALREFYRTKSFIVTHSNHILDTSLDYKSDISIFSFEKSLKGNKATFNILNLSSPDISLLNMLGVRNSSIFLSNCCLWVEGISDRIFLKKYLEVYIAVKEAGILKATYLEDLHYTFLEFGGNQIVHYSFAKDDRKEDKNRIKAHKITSRLLVIHDLDEGKDKRHELLSSQLGENYLPLETREIENLLSPQILKATLRHYQKNKDLDPLIFKEFSQDDYAKKPFGEWINSCISSGTINKICSPGTKNLKPKLLNKADFALIATGQIQSWDDLSPAAQRLTIKVYNFIKSHNVF